MFSYMMPIYSLIVLVTFDNSFEHFIPSPSACLLADLCNHTWVPQCGRNSKSDVQEFKDDCSRHEYNCDNEKDFEEVEMKVCEDKISITTTEPIITTTVSTSTESTSTESTTTSTSTESTTSTTESTTTTTPTAPTTTTKIAPANHNCSRTSPPLPPLPVSPCPKSSRRRLENQLKNNGIF